MTVVEYTLETVTGGSSYRTIPAPTSQMDHNAGVLYVSLREPEGPVINELDDEEIFVFSEEATGDVVAFTIPHFEAYWADHTSDLFEHLSSYVPNDDKAGLATVVFKREASTA